MPVAHKSTTLSQLRRPVSQFYSVVSMLVALVFLNFFSHKALAAEEYTGISAPMLKHMMENDRKVVVVNVLSGIEYEMHHITGSINIPINLLEGCDRLPADKNTPLVFYCMGHR